MTSEINNITVPPFSSSEISSSLKEYRAECKRIFLALSTLHNDSEQKIGYPKLVDGELKGLVLRGIGNVRRLIQNGYEVDVFSIEPDRIIRKRFLISYQSPSQEIKHVVPGIESTFYLTGHIFGSPETYTGSNEGEAKSLQTAIANSVELAASEFKISSKSLKTITV